MHRDANLKNIYLVERLPEYPPAQAGSAQSLTATENELEEDTGRLRGMISDFDYACRTVKSASNRAKKERAAGASDDQNTIASLRTVSN